MIKDGNWNTENFYVLELSCDYNDEKSLNYKYKLSKIKGKIQRIDDKFYINSIYYTMTGIKLEEVLLIQLNKNFSYKAVKLFLNKPNKIEIKSSIKEMKKSISIHMNIELENKIKLMKNMIKDVKSLKIKECKEYDLTDNFNNDIVKVYEF